MDTAQLITGLTIVVHVLVLIVLYHVLFLVVDLRKIFQRIELLTKELETVLLKPLSMTDKVFSWAIDALNSEEKEKKKKK